MCDLASRGDTSDGVCLQRGQKCVITSATSLRGGHFCIGTNGRHPEAGSNKWRVFVQIPFWSAQQETCVT